jgi:S1-C subfamily serine protease
MVLNSTLVIVAVALSWIAAPRTAAAQSCAGPGVAFGVTSYECEKCAFSWNDGRAQYTFHVEPKVLSVAPGSVLRAGDVIVGVGTHRITTDEGARLFTTPPPRSVVRLDVMRDGKRVVTIAEINVDCAAPRPAPASSEQAYTVQPGPGDVEPGKVGFALACSPSCTRTKGPNGVDYWKFDAPPQVVAVRSGSPAERSGMRVGDIVVEVDGKPVMTPDANYRLFTFPSEGGKIQLTFDREGKRVTFTLHASSSR